MAQSALPVRRDAFPGEPEAMAVAPLRGAVPLPLRGPSGDVGRGGARYRHSPALTRSGRGSNRCRRTGGRSGVADGGIIVTCSTGPPGSSRPGRSGLPAEGGRNWRGVHHRLRMWAVDGTWKRAFTALTAQADDAGQRPTSTPRTVGRTAAGSGQGGPLIHRHPQRLTLQPQAPRPAPPTGSAPSRRGAVTSLPYHHGAEERVGYPEQLRCRGPTTPTTARSSHL